MIPAHQNHRQSEKARFGSLSSSDPLFYVQDTIFKIRVASLLSWDHNNHVGTTMSAVLKLLQFSGGPGGISQRGNPVRALRL